MIAVALVAMGTGLASLHATTPITAAATPTTARTAAPTTRTAAATTRTAATARTAAPTAPTSPLAAPTTLHVHNRIALHTYSILGSRAGLSYVTDERETVKTVTGKVIFTVNRTDIHPGDAFLEEIRHDILPLIREQHLQLYRIDVRGAASPEGPTDGNERLAIGRARVLTDSLTAILPSAEGDLFHTRTVTEDYELLLEHMEAAADPDAPLVEGLIRRWGSDIANLKWALYTAKGRTLWPRLLRDYFPELRATRVTLYFRIDPGHEVTPPPAAEPLPTPQGDQPALGEHDIILPPLTPLPEDSLTTDTLITPERIHRRPVIALSTNLLYDLWYQPDFGFAPMWNGKVEWYPYSERHTFWNHTSLAAGFTNPFYQRWETHEFFQIRNYELEARWYHRYDDETQQRYGWYVGAALDANIYGIGLSDTKGWQGEGTGAQLTGGYVLPLGRCKAWKLEFNVGVGIYRTDYDPYQYEDPFAGSDHGHGEYTPPTFLPGGDLTIHYYYKWYGNASDFRERQHRFRWIGPTQIGVSLKYDILWKRKTKRGLSFRHWEPAGKGGEP